MAASADATPARLVARSASGLRYEHAVPHGTHREWRYTQLKRFDFSGLELAKEPKDESISERIRMRIDDSDAEGVMVHKGNKVVHRQANIKEAGVVFTDLRTAIKEHEELVKQHLYSVVNATQTKYTALNSALWENGTFVYVPANVEVELPLGAFTTADAGGVGLGRTLIVVDVNARLTFLDEFTSDPFDGHLFFDAATEIVLKDGAKLRYVSLQNWSRNVAHINKLRAHLGRDSRLESVTVSLGGDAARVEVESQLEGPGSRARCSASTSPTRAALHQFTLQHHSTSGLLGRCLQGRRARRQQLHYSGMIVVDPAPEDGRLPDQPQPAAGRGVRVVPSAARDRANDVKCSHGSTTGPVPRTSASTS